VLINWNQRKKKTADVAVAGRGGGGKRKQLMYYSHGPQVKWENSSAAGKKI